MKVAAQLYTIRDYTATDKEVRNSFKKIWEIGYRAVQVSGLAAYNPENIARCAEEYGLEICVTHTPLNRIVNETGKVIQEHELFKTGIVGLGWFRGKTIGDYRALISQLEKPIAEMKSAGLRFVYHNHAHEFMRLDGGVRPIDVLEKEGKDIGLDFLPDLYWVQTAGESPVRFLRKLKGRTPAVHFKDMKVPISQDKTNMAEIFEGNMDYDAIYNACLKLGVEWAVVEQDFCDGDPFDSLALSLKNMQNHGMFV